MTPNNETDPAPTPTQLYTESIISLKRKKNIPEEEKDLSVVEYRQLPAYGLADLFADIGGTLGLWMGISVLTIMELMELIIRLIGLMFNVESDLPADEKDETHTGQKRVPAPKTHNGGSAPHESNYPDPYGPPEFNFRRGVEQPTN
ncbi:FMRFamide-activated amiloride-sensitive sodium channel-like isoform X2 [Biomphalaria glabrata]